MIRVVIADDHQILREGLKQLLLSAGDLDVVGEARDGHEVLERIRALELDVLLLDMSMPGKSGVALHEEHQYAVRAIRAGASGYLTKESAAAQLVAAIRKVAGGGAFISAEVAERLALDAMPHAEGPLHASLSDREYQVFQLLVAGVSVSDIALRLHLSAKTISTHKARLMEKLEIDNNADLVRYAVRHRLHDDPNASA
jgi:DNA-binding NarL/FixJ family response regulator